MPLLGKGMLVVFTEVKARDERDFNEWYNREHIDERINLPGFHRARRYVAVRGLAQVSRDLRMRHGRRPRDAGLPRAARQPDAVDPGGDGASSPSFAG